MIDTDVVERLEKAVKDIEKAVKERTDAIAEAYNLIDRIRFHLGARDDYELRNRELEFISDLEVLLDEASNLTSPNPDSTTLQWLRSIHKNCIAADANDGAEVCALCGWMLSEEERAKARKSSG